MSNQVALERINNMRIGYPSMHYLGDAEWARLDLIFSSIRMAFNNQIGRAPWHIYLKVADALEKAGY